MNEMIPSEKAKEILDNEAKETLSRLANSQEKPVMIEWTGNNLRDVIEFTGKSPRFDEWFKTWEEYESYVHSHGNILKLFNEDGTHLEVPVGAWIFKTPDGRNIPSTFLYQEQSVCEEFDREFSKFSNDVDTEHPFPICVDEYKDFARHFYELGRQSKPNDQWSEEDEEMLNSIIATCKLAQEERDSSPARHLFKMQERWLKSHYFNVKAEKPTPAEGLEEEIERYLSTEWELDEDLNKDEPIYIYDCTWEDLKVLARHFAKWQKEKDNEVADKALTTSIKLQEGWYAKGIADGEKSMREQMMKEAVEWLDENAWEFAITKSKANYEEFVRYDSRGLLEAFKKAIIKED